MSDQIRIGAIGCGYWGKNLVRNFNELGVLHAICDEAASGREQAGTVAPGVPVHENIDAILGDEAVQGVVIATPAETHYEVACRALRSGKDVLVEKPLALTYEEGAEMVRLAEENGRILAVGHVLEYHPGIRKLLELIRSHELGKILYIYSNRLSLGKIRREENILWSFAPHDIAIILRIVGTMPFQVSAWGGSYVQPNIADVTVSNLLFDNGLRAHIHVSWLHPFKEQRLVVIGSQKMATFDDVNKELLLYDQRVEVKDDGPVPIKAAGEKVSYESSEPLKAECQAFIDAIASRKAPLTDGRSGLKVLKVLQAAQRSLIMNGDAVTLSAESTAAGISPGRLV